MASNAMELTTASPSRIKPDISTVTGCVDPLCNSARAGHFECSRIPAVGRLWLNGLWSRQR